MYEKDELNELLPKDYVLESCESLKQIMIPTTTLDLHVDTQITQNN